MPAGGRRPGAGRRPGSVNRASMQAREAAMASGELPHEFLLKVSRGEKIGDHEPTFSERVDAAKAAAPYYAARLATTRIEASVRRSVTELTDEELLAVVNAARSPPE